MLNHKTAIMVLLNHDPHANRICGLANGRLQPLGISPTNYLSITLGLGQWLALLASTISTVRKLVEPA
jgi:hypothetical protein